MNAKRSTVMIGLILALIVALGVICYLVMSKKTTEQPRPLSYPRPQRQVAPHSKGTIVLFYAEWCGHSQKIKPEWEQAKQILTSKGYQVIEKESESAKDEIQSQGVTGFPTIRFYSEGYPSSNFKKYQGDRTAQSIVSFVESQSV